MLHLPPATSNPASQFSSEFLKLERFTASSILRLKRGEVVIKRPQPSMHGVRLEPSLAGMSGLVEAGEGCELE